MLPSCPLHLPFSSTPAPPCRSLRSRQVQLHPSVIPGSRYARAAALLRQGVARPQPAAPALGRPPNRPVLLLPQLHGMACAERCKLPALPADRHPRHLHSAGCGPGGFIGAEAACLSASSTACWSAAGNCFLSSRCFTQRSLHAPPCLTHHPFSTALPPCVLAPACLLTPALPACLHLLVQDSPSPGSPKYRSWLQWMVINIPQHDVQRGEVGPHPTAAGGNWGRGCRRQRRTVPGRSCMQRPVPSSERHCGRKLFVVSFSPVCAHLRVLPSCGRWRFSTCRPSPPRCAQSKRRTSAPCY